MIQFSNGLPRLQFWQAEEGLRWVSNPKLLGKSHVCHARPASPKNQACWHDNLGI